MWLCHIATRSECTWRKNDNNTWLHNNITLILYFSKVFDHSVVWDRQMETNRDGRRRRLTAILRHYFFFSLLYNAVLSSRPHLALLLLSRRLLNRRPAVGRSVGCFPCEIPRYSQAFSLTESLLAASWDWLKTETVFISVICIYHFTPTFCSTTWLIPLIFSGTSAAEDFRVTLRLRVNMQQLLVIQTYIYTIPKASCRWNHSELLYSEKHFFR